MPNVPATKKEFVPRWVGRGVFFVAPEELGAQLSWLEENLRLAELDGALRSSEAGTGAPFARDGCRYPRALVASGRFRRQALTASKARWISGDN
jgi:hypothetical protein